MEFQELRTFIKKQSNRLKHYYADLDHHSLILAGAVKLSEELGELCQEILAYQSIQRKEKLSSDNHDKLAQEFADAIITPLILAEWMGIDIEKALEEKIEIIKQRYIPCKKDKTERSC